MGHGRLPEAPHHHLLLPQLLGHVLGAGAGHVDPGLVEEGAGAEHERDVEDGVDRVRQHRPQGLVRRQVAAEPVDGGRHGRRQHRSRRREG